MAAAIEVLAVVGFVLACLIATGTAIVALTRPAGQTVGVPIAGLLLGLGSLLGTSALFAYTWFQIQSYR